MVTPVFAASYSGLFKTFFDVLEAGALDGKPVLVAATAGTARHSLVLEHALRPLFAYLHAVVVPTGVFAATDDFGDTGLDARVYRAAGELAALAGKVSAVDSAVPSRRSVEDELADPTPFEQLLREARTACGASVGSTGLGPALARVRRRPGSSRRCRPGSSQAVARPAERERRRAVVGDRTQRQAGAAGGDRVEREVASPRPW